MHLLVTSIATECTRARNRSRWRVIMYPSVATMHANLTERRRAYKIRGFRQSGLRCSQKSEAACVGVVGGNLRACFTG